MEYVVDDIIRLWSMGLQCDSFWGMNSMKYRQIGLGTKIELELYNKDGEKIRPVLVSQYESYDEESNLMLIHVPFFQGRIYPVHTMTQMDIIFSREGDTYMFRAEAAERIVVDDIAMLNVKPVSPIQRIERRSFFRMECELSIRYRVVGSPTSFEEVDKEDGKSFISSRTKNISGGGVCMEAHEQLETGSYIEAFLTLNRTIRFIGMVVRSIAVRSMGRILYETGIEFKTIENKDRERIISYVFETQRERLKRGWMKT